MLKALKFDKNLILLNLAFFLRGNVFLLPVTLFFYQYNGLSAKELFLFQGFFYLTALLFELPIGYLADFFSRKKVLLTSMILFLSAIGIWFAFRGFWVVLSGEILFALSKVTMDTSTSTYLYEYLKREGKPQFMSKYFGYLNFFLSIGSTLASLAGIWLFIQFGIKKVIFTEFLFILLAIILLMFLPDIKSEKKNANTLLKQYASMHRLFKNFWNTRQVKYYMILSGIMVAAANFFTTSLQPLMQKAMLPVVIFGVITFINYLTRSIAGLMVHFVYEKADFKNLAYTCFYLFLAGFILLFGILTIQNKAVCTFLLILICLIIASQLIFTYSHISRFQKYFKSQYRSGVTSVNSFIARIFTALTFLLTGVLYSQKMFGLYFVFLAFFVIISLCMFYKLRKLKKDE